MIEDYYFTDYDYEDDTNEDEEYDCDEVYAMREHYKEHSRDVVAREFGGVEW